MRKNDAGDLYLPKIPHIKVLGGCDLLVDRWNWVRENRWCWLSNGVCKSVGARKYLVECLWFLAPNRQESIEFLPLGRLRFFSKAKLVTGVVAATTYWWSPNSTTSYMAHNEQRHQDKLFISTPQLDYDSNHTIFSDGNVPWPKGIRTHFSTWTCQLITMGTPSFSPCRSTIYIDRWNTEQRPWNLAPSEEFCDLGSCAIYVLVTHVNFMYR